MLISGLEINSIFWLGKIDQYNNNEHCCYLRPAFFGLWPANDIYARGKAEGINFIDGSETKK